MTPILTLGLPLAQRLFGVPSLALESPCGSFGLLGDRWGWLDLWEPIEFVGIARGSWV